MKKNEIKEFMRGAEYFQKDYLKLKNKEQFKEEQYLNTGLWYFVKKENIYIFTSCIASTDYLFRIIHPPIYHVEIYYYETRVDMNVLKKQYTNSNVNFIKLKKNPRNEFSNETRTHNTIVFAGDDTVIFDSKMLGLYHNSNNKITNVYRDKYKIDYQKYFKRAKSLI